MTQQAHPRHVVITGGSSGIGRATATAFAAAGDRLLILSRNPGDPLPGLVRHRSVDVRDGDALREVLSQEQEEFGPFDILINNAGVMPLGRIDTQDPAEWEQVFSINALAILHASQAVLPEMIVAGSGTIVTVSSIAGRGVFANHTAYSGTKFAAHAMMESMRREYAADGIRFTTVAPGIVDTNLLSSVSDPAIVAGYQVGKDRLDGGLKPEDVAEAIFAACALPQRVCVREIVIAATGQES